VVIHPPVNVEEFKLGKTRDDFYLTVARLVPYKKVDVVVEAFARLPERRLIVIGSGPGLSEIRKAAPRNVTLMGYQPFEVLRDYMQRARGFVFAATEDFGISPVEAMACGTPIIGLAKGGLLETVIGLGNERPTGVFFDTLSPEAICDAVIRFEKNSELFSAQVIRENALRFSASRFRKEFRELVEEKMGEDDARRGR
jgi:glycosyltransferase involved in cell wall biosynthesis